MGHLIFLTTSYPRFQSDEASIFVARLAESLVASGEKLDVLVPLDTTEPKQEIRNGVRINRFKYRFGTQPGLAFAAGLVANIRARPWQAWQLFSLVLGLSWRAWRIAQPHSVVVANWILAAWAAAIAYLLGGSKFVYIVRGQEMRLLGSAAGKLLFSFPLKLASHVVCVSQSFAEQLSARFPHYEGKISFIPNGITVNLDAEVPTGKAFLKEPYLLMIGTVTPVKDLKRAISLFNQGLSQKFNLVVIGRLNDRGYLGELENLIRLHGLSERVHFIGEVAPENISSYLKGAAGFLSTSIHEGMPNALLEAMALGRFVIVSDIAAHREVVKDGESGLILTGDLIKDVELIMRVVDDSFLLNKLGSAAVDAVKVRSWTSTAQQYVEVFTHL